eukprot:360458-Chlamydomonas_euryale.AAC.10
MMFCDNEAFNRLMRRVNDVSQEILSHKPVKNLVLQCKVYFHQTARYKRIGTRLVDAIGTMARAKPPGTCQHLALVPLLETLHDNS